MEEIARGALSKMTARLESNAPVQYAFRLDDREVAVNPLIGRPLRLEYLGSIFCTHCGRKTKKSFSQGYCYPCFTRLAQCDSCIVSPEKCHYEQGTCREPEWGERFCMTDHVVYLANSSGVKVGITRASQIPTRWIDQGARRSRTRPMPTRWRPWPRRLRPKSPSTTARPLRRASAPCVRIRRWSSAVLGS